MFREKVPTGFGQVGAFSTALGAAPAEKDGVALANSSELIKLVKTPEQTEVESTSI